MRTDSIVIVGGGSAGWMTAASLISNLPNKKITVVESANVPTVGVGESTLPSINTWMESCGIKKEDVIKNTDASLKFSIKFTDWNGVGSGSFHFPFGGAIKDSQFGIHEWFIHKAFNKSIPNTDFAKVYNPAVALCDYKKIDLNNSIRGWEYQMDTAYHIDASMFGAWLRDSFCKPKGVNHIISTINENIEVDENGITHLELEDGTKIKADLYIDCTGFKSLLLKSLGVGFDDYSDMLPNDKAWAVRLDYKDKERELDAETNCTALPNGWVWNTPLWSRIGTGYVYSSKYVSDEDALAEFKEHLGDRVSPDAQFRNISMRCGIHKELFRKNVVAIGLSAGFIEPLESNGLFSVHEFLHVLVRTLSRDNIGYYDKYSFNQYTRKMFVEFAEFVVMHYALSNRDDTKYWRDAKERPLRAGHREAWITDLIKIKHVDLTFKEASGMAYIAAGLDYNPITEYDIKNMNVDHLRNLEYNRLMQNRNRWEEICKGLPTLYSHIKELHEG